MKYFDLHCDTISYLFDEQLDFDNPVTHIAAHKLGKISTYKQVFALWCGNDPAVAPQRYAPLLAFGRALCAEQSLRPFFSVEGAELLSCDVSLLAQAKSDGVLSVGVVWNFDNSLCGCAKSDTKRGLSDAGRDFISTAVGLRMAVDVSHASTQGFWDILSVAKGQTIATHSNARAICPHFRNLWDEQILALCAHDGLIGLNLYSEFLDRKQANIHSVLTHIEHILSLGAEDNLAVGADFDGCDSLPVGIGGLDDIPGLFQTVAETFGSAIAEKIFFQNACDFFLRIGA